MDKVYYSSAWTGIVTTEETWHRAGAEFRELCRKPRAMFRNIYLIAGSHEIARNICEVDLGFSRVSMNEWRSYGGVCLHYISNPNHLYGRSRDAEVLFHPSVICRSDYRRFENDVYSRFVNIYRRYEDIK